MQITWADGNREPAAKPNPAFPNGIDVDLSNGASDTCWTKLDYPAPRIGAYIVVCEACDLRVIVSTAGRADDPRSVKVACKGN